MGLGREGRRERELTSSNRPHNFLFQSTDEPPAGREGGMRLGREERREGGKKREGWG